jgi:N-acetylmuramic acid 6-phosphate etherase
MEAIIMEQNIVNDAAHPKNLSLTHPENLSLLRTEESNPLSADLDMLSTLDMVRLMNTLDQDVPRQVGAEAETIARAIDLVVAHLRIGGRLIYAGAGTSGRLGILDASECPPTFGVSPDLISGIIAGGQEAIFRAMEGVEDDEDQAANDLAVRSLTSRDVVLAIASSGRTPYCVGALQYAAQVGAGRISLSCNKQARLSAFAEVAIEVDSGPEVITGSTRLKAGTAQKLVLNMISTLSMVQLGHVYKNLMVGTRGINVKLDHRVLRLFMEATGTSDPKRAHQLLAEADGSLKTAIVAELAGVGVVLANQALAAENGHVRNALMRLGLK